MALKRAFSFVKVCWWRITSRRGSCREREKEKERYSEGDGKIKEVGVYLFCSLFSLPRPAPHFFVLLKIFRV